MRQINLVFSTNRLAESYKCALCGGVYKEARKPETVIRGRYDNWVSHQCPEQKETDE